MVGTTRPNECISIDETPFIAVLSKKQKRKKKDYWKKKSRRRIKGEGRGVEGS